jgi:type II secretory pathway predicted ATPase ExeA
MYLAHWGIDQSPFAAGAAPLFYEGESQAEAAARLRFVARHARRMALLAGPAGVGKSLVLRRFAESCRREGRRAALVSAEGLSVRELLWQATAQLALGPQPADDAVALHRRLALAAHALQMEHTTITLIVDDADQAGPDVRTQLVRLAKLGGEPTWLTLVLSAASGHIDRLGPDLLSAIELRIDLEPWSESETIGYVQHALLEAGCDRPAFNDEALAAVYAVSEGVPRQVNRVADHALLAAAGEGLEQITATTIDAAFNALSWLTPA